MLGQAQTAQRRAILLVVAAIAVLVVPALSGANLARHRQNPRAGDRAIERQSRAAVLEVYALDHRLASARSQLSSLAAQMTALRAQRAVLRRQIQAAQKSQDVSEAVLMQRVRQLYENGEVEPIEIVLGSRNLDDALSNIDGLSRMSGQAEQVVGELKATRAQLERQSQALATQQSALAAAIRQAAETQAALAAARASKTAYVARLAQQKRLNDAQVASLLAQARAAQRKSARITQARTAQSRPSATYSPAPDAVRGGRTLTVSATGYSLPGHTSSGLPVGWGVVAVDPSVIPLGTHMTIPGYGEAVAADTGSSIVGARVDLWFPTFAQASAWGRRTVTIVLH